MPNRVHKVWYVENGPNIFTQVKLPNGSGTLPDLTTAAAVYNPNWPAYEEVCVETYGLDAFPAPLLGVHQNIVLRGTLRCCCAPPCIYQSDHDARGNFAVVPRMRTMDPNEFPVLHSPGQSYCEASIDSSKLQPILDEANQVVGVEADRVAFATQLATEAAQFNLTAYDIESQLGISGTDANGRLSASGATMSVLAGVSTVALDYYFVAMYIVLFQMLV